MWKLFNLRRLLAFILSTCVLMYTLHMFIQTPIIMEQDNSENQPHNAKYETQRETASGVTTVATEQTSDNKTIRYINIKKDNFLKMFQNECDRTKIPPDNVAKDGEKQCPCVPEKLVGRKLPDNIEPSWQELEMLHPDMTLGGHWSPISCKARQRACLFLPYRDRESHLLRWLRIMIPFLKKQNSDFRIFVSEQNNGSRFNRGMLINAGIAYTEKEGIKCDCVIIHDVDHVPEDDRNMYFCQHKPIHLAVARNDHKYRLPYGSFVGGAIATRLEDYKKMNGFSNLYFGWGSEDDDIEMRFKSVGLGWKRYPTPISFYTMFKHEHAVENKDRWKFVRAWSSRRKVDGLVDVLDQCTIRSAIKRKLLTLIHVDIDEDAVLERSKSKLPFQLPKTKT